MKADQGGPRRVLGWQAYPRGCGDLDKAQALSADARLASRSREVAALWLLTEAIIALAVRDEATAADRLNVVIDNRVWDPVVIAVRTAPPLASSWRVSSLARLVTACSLLHRQFIGQPPRTSSAAGGKAR
jgi:hypothetical protein